MASKSRLSAKAMESAMVANIFSAALVGSGGFAAISIVAEDGTERPLRGPEPHPSRSDGASGVSEELDANVRALLSGERFEPGRLALIRLVLADDEKVAFDLSVESFTSRVALGGDGKLLVSTGHMPASKGAMKPMDLFRPVTFRIRDKEGNPVGRDASMAPIRAEAERIREAADSLSAAKDAAVDSAVGSFDGPDPSDGAEIAEPEAQSRMVAQGEDMFVGGFVPSVSSPPMISNPDDLPPEAFPEVFEVRADGSARVPAGSARQAGAGEEKPAAVDSEQMASGAASEGASFAPDGPDAPITVSVEQRQGADVLVVGAGDDGLRADGFNKPEAPVVSAVAPVPTMVVPLLGDEFDALVGMVGEMAPSSHSSTGAEKQTSWSKASKTAEKTKEVDGAAHFAVEPSLEKPLVLSEVFAADDSVVEPAVVEPAVVEPAVVEPAVVEPAVVASGSDEENKSSGSSAKGVKVAKKKESVELLTVEKGAVSRNGEKMDEIVFKIEASALESFMEKLDSMGAFDADLKGSEGGFEISLRFPAGGLKSLAGLITAFSPTGVSLRRTKD